MDRQELFLRDPVVYHGYYNVLLFISLFLYVTERVLIVVHNQDLNYRFPSLHQSGIFCQTHLETLS